MVSAMSTRLVAAIAAAALGIAAGTGCDEPLQPVAGEATLLAAAGDYTKWARPKNREEREPVLAPHGGFVDIYINEVVEADLAMVVPEGLLEWSEGAMVALAGFSTLEGEAPVQVALLRKRHGAWEWEQYGDIGEPPRFSGRPDVCVGCHNTGEDFIRSFRLPDPPKE